MKKIINYLNDAIKKEKNLLIFTTLVFFIGLVLGSLFINFITKSDKALLIDQLSMYLSSIKKLSNDVFGIKVFFNNFSNNSLQLTIIFVLGISIIGVLAVILILFFKGFMLGTTLSTFILKYHFKGIIGMFFYVFPVMIINILIYIFLSFFAVHASTKVLKAFIKKDSLNFKTFLGKYLLSFVISILLMAILCIIDSYLTPLLLKLFTYII